MAPCFLLASSSKSLWNRQLHARVRALRMPDHRFPIHRIRQKSCKRSIVSAESPRCLCDFWNVTLSITIAALVVWRGRLQPSVMVCLAFMAL